MSLSTAVQDVCACVCLCTFEGSISHHVVSVMGKLSLCCLLNSRPSCMFRSERQQVSMSVSSSVCDSHKPKPKITAMNAVHCYFCVLLYPSLLHRCSVFLMMSQLRGQRLNSSSQAKLVRPHDTSFAVAFSSMRVRSLHTKSKHSADQSRAIIHVKYKVISIVQKGNLA